jgi:hypothetical protein
VVTALTALTPQIRPMGWPAVNQNVCKGTIFILACPGTRDQQT